MLLFLLFIPILGLLLVAIYYRSLNMSIVFNSIIKQFSLKNLITGIISLVIIYYIKKYGLPLYILNMLPNVNLNESDLALLIGIVSSVGLKGLIGEIINAFSAYNAMTMGGETNPTNIINSGVNPNNTSGGSSSTSNATDPPKEPSSTSNATDPDQKPVKRRMRVKRAPLPEGYIPGAYSQRRLMFLSDKKSVFVNEEIKKLSAKLVDCKDEEEVTKTNNELEGYFNELSLYSKLSVQSAKEIAEAEKKFLSLGKKSDSALIPESSSSKRRGSDSSLVDDSSKKR